MTAQEVAQQPKSAEERPISVDDCLDQGHVELLVRPATDLESILFFHRCLEESKVGRIRCLPNGQDGAIHIAMELREPLVLATFLGLLPGVVEVDGSQAPQFHVLLADRA